MNPYPDENGRNLPTRFQATVFRLKTLLLHVRRAAADQLFQNVKRANGSDELANMPVISRSRTPLWTETEPEERFLIAGKIHNLRLAARRLNGIEVGAGETFSFWKQVGRASRLKGYVEGRELREGCIIPNVGGGLCQISNALYDAALDANLEVIERHAHTQVVRGSLAEKDRDATVFWNYVDLRFRSEKPFRIEARLDDKDLIVVFRGEKLNGSAMHQIRRIPVHNDTPQSCATCEMGDCHRVVDTTLNRDFGKTAFLLDEFSPEFDRYVQIERASKDLLFSPLDGLRYRKSNYAWTTEGFGSVKHSRFVTAVRSYRSRKLSAQGRARQINLLAMYEQLAESYARRLRYDVLHVVVQQNLLPFLWKNGHLGGRTFDVLMTALPMAELQERLDDAARRHPESTTLADFRADRELVAVETEALKHARRIITPHSDIASLFQDRSVKLPWVVPKTKEGKKKPRNTKPVVVFPAATVGRKGCYELREALRGLDVKIILLGPLIEAADFWAGFEIEIGGGDWLDRADLVVLPAFIEHKPRRLISAAAQKIPVIATPACGVDGVDGVQTLQAGNVEQLRNAIKEVLFG
ncbi:MAG TPA: VanW family protein [Pyrinomonadaceae bacterium]|nr:VanW family protein [Pyrinomonadaceae bacterium]